MLAKTDNAPVNGIDTAALGTVVQAVKADPSKAKVGFDVVTRWTGQTGSETEVTGFDMAGERVTRSHTIRADEPLQLLGADQAANPQELLMAALNACMTVGYVANAALRGIALDKLEIRTKGELDLRGFLGLDDNVKPGYDTVEYEVTIAGDGSREDFEAIHQAVMKTSPNYYNVCNPIRTTAHLVVG
ncbi:OsmC family protein [Sphingomonas piscis]|uniref:OsmC family protein n=1 Tax=Sphingomonas piscis TaxID=2714943 RepID=A0A6G7YMA6_9SPHN|nr:OsmC family protein [Sphingomonas piscis]QIK77880.1 OsmC family protein [Sphingomonas piscis]